MAKTTAKSNVEKKVAETKVTETKAAEVKAAEVKTEVKAAKDTAKKAEKATETKAAEVKAETKTEEKAAAKTTKTSTTKAASKKTEEIYLQFSGFEFSDSELVEKVKADYIAAIGKKIFKSVKLYVKPEEMMVYYVVNEKYLGKVALA